MNNPLSYTDPSGYFFSKLLGGIGSFFRRWGRTIAAIGIGVISGGIAFSAASGGIFAIGAGASNVLGASIAAGAATGFSSALINTGSPKAAFTAGLLGGLSAGLANAIGHGIPGLGISGVPNDIRRLVAHGVAQGSVSRLQGGKFRSGFAGGFFGHLASGWVKGRGDISSRTAAAAIVGGTISKIAGGKFANGAVTAAFTHLFNAEAYGTHLGANPPSFGEFFGGLKSVVVGFARRSAILLGFTPSELGYGNELPIDAYSGASRTVRSRGLAAAGLTVATGSQYDIHHIVAHDALAADPARRDLAAVGIGVHDTVNLVALPRAVHQSLHNTTYYQAVNAATAASVSGGYNQMVSTLNTIRASLVSKGSYP